MMSLFKAQNHIAMIEEYAAMPVYGTVDTFSERESTDLVEK